jgi:hypothetical protein
MVSDVKLILRVDDFHSITSSKLRIERFNESSYYSPRSSNIPRKPTGIERLYKRLQMNLRGLSMKLMPGNLPSLP